MPNGFWFSPLPTAYQKKPYLCTVFRTDRIMSPRSVYRLTLSFNGSKRDKSERLCAYYSGTPHNAVRVRPDPSGLKEVRSEVLSR